jgi:hypothetical protein
MSTPKTHFERVSLKIVKKRIAGFKAANRRLRALSASPIRELHGSTGQNLTALKLAISAIAREIEKISSDLAGQLSESAELATRISDSLRRMAYPPRQKMSELGHPFTLTEEGNTVGQSHGQ